MVLSRKLRSIGWLIQGPYFMILRSMLREQEKKLLSLVDDLVDEMTGVDLPPLTCHDDASVSFISLQLQPNLVVDDLLTIVYNDFTSVCFEIDMGNLRDLRTVGKIERYCQKQRIALKRVLN